MKTLPLVACACALSAAYAVNSADGWYERYKPLKAAYLIYSGEPGERLRRKGDVWCSYRPGNGYRCFMGFNLRSGQSNSGASCRPS